MGAPRLPARIRRLLSRGALLASCLLAASQVTAQVDISSAAYAAPTDRYPHGVLGEPSEYTRLEVRLNNGTVQSLEWARPLVFEDVAPRLIDVDLDGINELLVVESHESLGARFTVYDLQDGALRPMVSNPHIGTRFRWLAIIGAADLDGDGFVEIAYVDRPHLARTLRVWRLIPGDPVRVVEVASLAGVTNHRIGEVDIAGGIRDCGAGPEMIVADARWARILAVRFDGASLDARDLGTHSGRASFAEVMGC